MLSKKQHQKYNNAAETLRRNFYVGYLKKSVNSREVASKLVDDMGKMCVARGFHPTKFISNDKEVLTTIPE